MKLSLEKTTLIFNSILLVSSLIGLLCVLNIIYLKPWNNPDLGFELQEITRSQEHSTLVMQAAKIIESSVPAPPAPQATPIPVNLEASNR